LIGGILIVAKSKVNHVAPPLNSFLETRAFTLAELDVVTSNRRLHVTCSLLYVEPTAFDFFGAAGGVRSPVVFVVDG